MTPWDLAIFWAAIREDLIDAGDSAAGASRSS